jgi:hypothetical protein
MSEETHAGIICVSDGWWHKVMKDVLNVDSLDIQGVLRGKDVFTEVHKRLLLPESYIVHNIFYKWRYRQWSIVVEGPDLPLVIEGMEYSQVTPIYSRNEDGSTNLVRIDI